MCMLFQFLLSFAIASLILIFVVERPSLARISSWYLLASTSSNVLLLSRTLLILVLTSIPYDRLLSFNLLLRPWNSIFLPPNKSTSSAKLLMILSSMNIGDRNSWRFSRLIFSMLGRINNADGRQNGFWITYPPDYWGGPALLEVLYSASMFGMKPSSMHKFLKICYKRSCHNLLKFFLKSIKLWNKYLWCCRYFSIRLR